MLKIVALCVGSKCCFDPRIKRDISVILPEIRWMNYVILTYSVGSSMLESRQMKRKSACFVVMLLLFALFSACSTQAGSQIPSVLSPTAAKLENPTLRPESCRPDRAQLDDLDAQLRYDQSVILYQTYAGEHTLVVWFVEPELGTEYTAENEAKAVIKAVEVAQILAQARVCDKAFDLFHITVVGVDYTQWFSGPIRPADIPSSGESGTGGSPDEERGAGVSVVTAEPPPLVGPNACAWQTVSTALDAEFSNMGVDADFYYVRDSNGNNVFVHWMAPRSEELLESIPLLVRVIEQIDCLYPGPTSISLTVAGEDGVVLLDGFLPGTQLEDGTNFSLDDFSYQLVDQ
jgi:hypothetical protein